MAQSHRRKVDDADLVLAGPDVRALVGVSKSTLHRMVCRGEFPRPIKLSPKRVGWRRSTVEAWLKSRAPGDKVDEMFDRILFAQMRKPGKFRTFEDDTTHLLIKGLGRQKE